MTETTLVDDLVARMEDEGYYPTIEARKAMAQLPEAHRGALDWHVPRGIVVLFENRPELSNSGGQQMDMLADGLAELGATSLALHTGDDAWAMLVVGIDAQTANELVWLTWLLDHDQADPSDFTAFLSDPSRRIDGRRHLQYRIACEAIASQYERLGLSVAMSA